MVLVVGDVRYLKIKKRCQVSLKQEKEREFLQIAFPSALNKLLLLFLWPIKQFAIVMRQQQNKCSDRSMVV